MHVSRNPKKRLPAPILRHQGPREELPFASSSLSNVVPASVERKYSSVHWKLAASCANKQKDKKKNKNPITSAAEMPRSRIWISEASRQSPVLSLGNDWHVGPRQIQFGLKKILYDDNDEPSMTYQLSDDIAEADKMQQRATRIVEARRNNDTDDAVTRPQSFVLVAVRTTGRSINQVKAILIFNFFTTWGENCARILNWQLSTALSFCGCFFLTRFHHLASLLRWNLKHTVEFHRNTISKRKNKITST